MAKKPTGARPKPSVTTSSAPKSGGSRNATKPAIKHTPMGKSRASSTMGDTSKRRGA
jgi:hypothetical protein